MIRTTIRVASRNYSCDTLSGRCGGAIGRGERYLEHVASPHHDDLGNSGWWRLRECARCAEVYGRPIEGAA